MTRNSKCVDALFSDSDWQNEKESMEHSQKGYAIHLKGQMMYMPEWESIIFLGTPM